MDACWPTPGRPHARPDALRIHAAAAGRQGIAMHGPARLRYLLRSPCPHPGASSHHAYGIAGSTSCACVVAPIVPRACCPYTVPLITAPLHTVTLTTETVPGVHGQLGG